MQGGATGRPGKALSRKRHLHRDSRLGELHQADIRKGQPEMNEQSLEEGPMGTLPGRGAMGRRMAQRIQGDYVRPPKISSFCSAA